MVLTVTLNPCLDKTVFVPRMEPAGYVPVRKVVRLAGGKGVNVARFLKTLGDSALAFTVLAGAVGDEVQELLRGEGIPHEVVRVGGLTRTELTVVDEATGRVLQLNERGPEVSPGEAGRAKEKVLELIGSLRPELLVISGSVSRGALLAVLPAAIEAARALGVRTVLDTRDEALRAGICAVPFMVKPNLAEAGKLLGRNLDTDVARWEAMAELEGCGVAVVVLSLGAEGALMRAGGKTWKAIPPHVRPLNPIASGDAFVAGFSHGLIRGMDFIDCLRWGTAAGAANASTYEAGFSVELVGELLSGVRTNHL